MKSLFLAAALLCSSAVFASSIEGKWRTIDDATGKPKAVVSISKVGNGYNGRIISLANDVKNECPGCNKPQPLVGMTVVRGLQADTSDANKFENGKIFDPKSGKTYSVKAEVVNGGKALKVRGYLGISALGRTQTWQRVE